MKASDHNETLKLMISHSSVRHFTDQDVSSEDERAIVEAATMASSSCNMQPYSFVSVRNPESRRWLASLSGGAHMAEKAPLVLMVCVDQYKLDYVALKAGMEHYVADFLESFIVGVSDASIAAQNAALAAESLGYGICYIGSFRSSIEEVSTLLKLPDRVFPLFGIAVGVPSRRNPIKPRIPLTGTWFQETYDTGAAERAVDDYDRVMVSSGVYDGRHFPLDTCMVRRGAEKENMDNKESAYGWIEHTARRLSSTADEDVRPGLRNFLEKIGFRFK